MHEYVYRPEYGLSVSAEDTNLGDSGVIEAVLVNTNQVISCPATLNPKICDLCGGRQCLADFDNRMRYCRELHLYLWCGHLFYFISIYVLLHLHFGVRVERFI